MRARKVERERKRERERGRAIWQNSFTRFIHYSSPTSRCSSHFSLVPTLSSHTAYESLLCFCLKSRHDRGGFTRPVRARSLLIASAVLPAKRGKNIILFLRGGGWTCEIFELFRFSRRRELFVRPKSH